MGGGGGGQCTYAFFGFLFPHNFPSKLVVAFPHNIFIVEIMVSGEKEENLPRQGSNQQPLFASRIETWLLGLGKNRLNHEAEPHCLVGSVADLRILGGRWFDLRFREYSFRGLIIVIATGSIPF